MIKNLLTLLFGTFFMVSFSQTGQNADPAILEVLQSPNTVEVGETAVITVKVGNAGSDDIVTNGVILILSWGSFYEFVELVDEDQGLASAFTLIAQEGSTVRFRNTEGELPNTFGGVGPDGIANLKIRIRAIDVGGPADIPGYFTTAPGFASQVGNTSIQNDNALGNHSAIAATIFPVELTEFTAISNGNQADLFWTTSSENNNDYFSVQRSKNGTTFEEIARVKGAGTTNIVQQYSYIDTSAAYYADTVYYKLVQVDFNGSINSTDIKTVKFDYQVTENAIYPNPIESGRSVFVGGKNIESVDIYSVKGQLISVLENLNTNVVEISTAGFTKGTYIIVVNKKERSKLIVK